MTYRTSDQEGYTPSFLGVDSIPGNDGVEEKRGWFHCWTYVSEKDSQSGLYLTVAEAVIETEDGKLVSVPFRYVTFDEKE